MLQEIADVSKKKMQGIASGPFLCPKCNRISRTSAIRCLFCDNSSEMNNSTGAKLQRDLNGSPPRKAPRICSRQVVTPILILSVGRDGVFDARHSPCIITSNLLSCKVKVEGTWTGVEIRPSEVEAMLFSEELQLIFLRLRELPRNNLCFNLKVGKVDSVKWLVMVLGDNMLKPMGMNLMVQQLEIFGSTIRQHDGFCKMNYTCEETRKLLLDCGLRLPRAEVFAAKDCGSSVSGNSITKDGSGNSLVQSGMRAAPLLNSSTDGGLLTNVIRKLSSAGMHIFPSSQNTSHAISKEEPHQPPDKTDDGSLGDDIIILSEEGTDQHRHTNRQDSGAPNVYETFNSGNLTTASDLSSDSSIGSCFKFDYHPPGSSDSVMITANDLDCIPPGALVNDAIINFYLKYLYFEQLTDLQRRSTHLFNCFFYSRLANTPQAGNNSVTSATTPSRPDANALSITRHASVAKWTRRVDLFTKDYIIIPINENSHWFLGLVCYPWMAGMVSYTALYQAEAFDMCKLNERFADVDDINFSENVDDVSISEEVVDRRPTDQLGEAFNRWRRRRLAWLRKRGINAMPCILLFDSLPCQTRVANLYVIREYLQVEWNSRRAAQDGPLQFDKDTIRGFSPRVPCQSNLVDCGIYLLHYVEMFYKEPVQSYTKVFFQNQLTSWFSEASVCQKRSEILALIKRLQTNSVATVAASASLPVADG